MPSFLAQLRSQCGYSQGQLAGRIGISRQTFAQIEKGESELTVSQAKKLAEIFEISLQNFLEERLAPEPKVAFKKGRKGTKEKLRVIVPPDKVKKFKEALLYVLGRVGARPNVGQTVLYKLFYFIDFDYFEKYGKHLIGATYIKNHYGPTPVEFKKIVEDMEKSEELETVKSRYYKYDQKKYLPCRAADLNAFDAQEVKFIDHTLERLAEKNAQELSAYSHGDMPWRIAEEGGAIDYELVWQRERPYTERDYDKEEQKWAEEASRNDIEETLPPLAKEEIEYYERIAKLKNAR